MQTEPTDTLLEAIVAARESGASLHACMEVVADVFAAPWSAAAPSAQQPAGASAPTEQAKHDILFSILISASALPTTKFGAAMAEPKARGARP